MVLLKAQLYWAGHIIWMGNEHILNQLFFGELAQGQRKQGWPQKCYKDTLKSSLQWCGIKPSKLNIAAQVCPYWHAFTCIACASLEKSDKQNSLQPMITTTELLLPLSQQWPSSVPLASNSTNPECCCRAIPRSTDRSTDQFIPESRGQPPYRHI